MQLLIASVILAVVAADRLENTYLPPGSAKTAGGNGNFLNAPSQGGNVGAQYSTPSAQYGAPSGQSTLNKYNAPSAQYGAPQGQAPSNKYGAPSDNYGAPGAGGRFGGNNFGGSQSPDANAAILRFSNENNGDGSYRFEFETENKIMQQEAGELKNIGTEQEAASVQGSYSYMGPDGVMYTVNYIADENGFRAVGDHIPTPPPVPEAIQRSLEKNAAEEASQGYASNNQQGNGYQNGGNGYQNGGNGYQNGGNGYQNGGYDNQNRQSGNGYQQGGNQQYQKQTQATSRQYLAPNKPSFNQQAGYKY